MSAVDGDHSLARIREPVAAARATATAASVAPEIYGSPNARAGGVGLAYM